MSAPRSSVLYHAIAPLESGYEDWQRVESKA